MQTYICVLYSAVDCDKMPMVRLQKHTSCRHYTLPRFRVYGISIAGAWFHKFEPQLDVSVIRQTILFKENLINPNVEVRLFAKRNGKWDIVRETQLLKTDCLVLPYIIVMRGSY